jgi:hypothetical protein
MDRPDLWLTIWRRCPGFGEVQRLLNGTQRLPSLYSIQLQQIVQALLKLVVSLLSDQLD